MNKKQTMFLYAVLFWIAYSTYIALEITVRGHSNWSMGMAAGIAMILIDGLNDYANIRGLLLQGVIGSALITGMEVVIGYVVLSTGAERIWDYTNLPLSACDGNINLFFSLLWVLLAIACAVISDAIRYYVFHGNARPTYFLCGKVIKLPKRECE